MVGQLVLVLLQQLDAARGVVLVVARLDLLHERLDLAPVVRRQLREARLELRLQRRRRLVALREGEHDEEATGDQQLLGVLGRRRLAAPEQLLEERARVVGHDRVELVGHDAAHPVAALDDGLADLAERHGDGLDRERLVLEVVLRRLRDALHALAGREVPRAARPRANCSVSSAGVTVGSRGAVGASVLPPLAPALGLAAGLACAEACATTAASTSTQDNSLGAKDMTEIRREGMRGRGASIGGRPARGAELTAGRGEPAIGAGPSSLLRP
jgi:hypothetical protein